MAAITIALNGLPIKISTRMRPTSDYVELEVF